MGEGELRMTASTVIHPAKKPPTACTGASKRHPECPTSCTLQLSLEQLLMDKKQLNQFKTFCLREAAINDLLAWLEMESYRSIKAADYRAFKARKLYQKYVREGSTHQIEVSRDVVTAIREVVQKTAGTQFQLAHEDIPLDLFDPVQNIVLSSMREDVYQRFLQSYEYQELLDCIDEGKRGIVGISDFDLFRFLGAGGFGMVLLATKRDTKKLYALKVIDKRILISQNQTHSIFREKEALASVEHPFIVPLRFAFQTEDHLCFVLDFIPGGNMYADLMRGPYTHARAIFYAAQIVLATHHLHELGILYRDLKPDNVLLMMDGYLKLADMGAARGMDENGCICSSGANAVQDKTAKCGRPTLKRRMTITGTHGYRAPEVYERNYGIEADWWNVGILIIEMLTAENPLRGENRKESEQMSKSKELLLPSYINPDVQDLALRLLQRDRTTRCGCGELGVTEIYEHPAFRDIKWEALLSLELKPPFELDLEGLTPRGQPVPRGNDKNQLDHFCGMVDFMKTSLAGRASFPLLAHDQQIFEDFDYTSNKVFEEELRSLQEVSEELEEYSFGVAGFC